MQIHVLHFAMQAVTYGFMSRTIWERARYTPESRGAICSEGSNLMTSWKGKHSMQLHGLVILMLVFKSRSSGLKNLVSLSY